jgi:tetratricopeptide (TPR) repeat protein
MLRQKFEGLPDNHPFKPECLFQLSQLFQRLGNHEKRKLLFVRVLQLRRQRGDAFQVAQTLRRLSDVNWMLGLRQEGIQQAKEALEIFERLRNPLAQARCLKDLAGLLLDNEDPKGAEDAATRAINLLLEKGQEFTLCQCHRTLGSIHRSKGERRRAIHHFKAALGIASKFNFYDQLFMIHYSLASLFFNEGELNESTACIEQVKLHTVNDIHRLGCAMFLQAKVWHQQGKQQDARSEVLRVLAIFEKLGVARDAANCRSLLRDLDKK